MFNSWHNMIKHLCSILGTNVLGDPGSTFSMPQFPTYKAGALILFPG